MEDEDEIEQGMYDFYDRTILNTLELEIRFKFDALKTARGIHRSNLLDDIIDFQKEYKRLSGGYYYIDGYYN